MSRTEQSQKLTEQGLQAQLAERMMGIFNSIVQERHHYYQKSPDEIPMRKNITSIIASWGNKNAMISGGVSLIPGPFGMAAAIPEVAWIIRNQISMIYDIGVAYGKSDVLTKELLAGVFGSALGVGGIGLLSMHGSKVLVKRTSLRVLQKIIALLAGKVTQRLLKSMISKWLPLVGGVAMAAWSKYTTNMVGKTAKEILSKTIEFEDEEVILEEIKGVEIIDIETGGNPTTTAMLQGNIEAPDMLKTLKILALMNLMKIDGKIMLEEISYIEQLIEHAGFDDLTRKDLQKKMTLPDKATIDYKAFAANPDESLGLMLDLIALAKRDQEFHVTEKMYIRVVAQ